MAVFSSPAAAQEVLSPGCAFVNSYSFPVVWTNQLGGSFSPTKNFNAGEVITVQMTWTGGPAATSATIHVTAAGLNFRQTVAPTGVLSSSYTLPSNSTYIDVGLDFAPANVGRGDINLTVTCKKGTVSTGAGNTDSARLGALVRLKAAAHYGDHLLSATDRDQALRQATALRSVWYVADSARWEHCAWPACWGVWRPLCRSLDLARRIARA